VKTDGGGWRGGTGTKWELAGALPAFPGADYNGIRLAHDVSRVPPKRQCGERGNAVDNARKDWRPRQKRLTRPSGVRFLRRRDGTVGFA
jgi:hypothetical protein